MKGQTILIIILIGILKHFGYSQSYRLIRKLNLKNELISSPYKNVLKLYDVAVDEAKGYAYTSGIVTSHIAKIDLQTKKEIASLPLPFPQQLNVIYCNKQNGYLYVATPKTSPVKLYSIHPNTGQNTGIYIYRTFNTDLAYYGNKVFLIDGPYLKILNNVTLTQLDSFPLGMQAGAIEIDTLTNSFYVVSRNLLSGNCVIKEYSLQPPYSLKRTLNIASPEPLGKMILKADTAFLIGKNNLKIISLSSGNVIKSQYWSDSISDAAYSVPANKLFLTDEDGYSQQGQKGSWTKIYIYDINTGTLDSVKRGDKAITLEMYNAQNILIYPNMHSGYVELWNLNTHVTDSIDVGESVDAMTLSPDKNKLFIAKRLGGSKLVIYDKIADTLYEINAGNWPCGVAVDSSLNKLFVLNEFESSVSVFDINTGALTDTIALPVPEARSDAIPTMKIDGINHKLFIAIPEYAKLIKVNTINHTVENVIPIPSFQYNENIHYGIGVIQLLTVPNHNELWMLKKVERKIHIFDVNTMNRTDTLNLNSLWNFSLYFSGNLLEYEPMSDKIFIGNLIFSPTTKTLIGNIPRGKRVLGTNGNIIYTLDVLNDTVKVFEHTSNNYTFLREVSLYKLQGKASPVFSYDNLNNELYISEFNEPILYRYDLDSIVTDTQVKNKTLKVFPNPFTKEIVIENPDNISELKIYNLQGQKVYSKKLSLSPKKQKIDLSFLPDGMYYLQLNDKQAKIIKMQE